MRNLPWVSGYDAWFPSVRLQVWVYAGSPCGVAWSLYTCVALWRAVYGPSATERPLGTIYEENGISSRLQVSVLTRYDLSCCKECKTPFIPSFIWYYHRSGRHFSWRSLGRNGLNIDRTLQSGIQLTTSPIACGYRKLCGAIIIIGLCSTVYYKKTNILRSCSGNIKNMISQRTHTICSLIQFHNEI